MRRIARTPKASRAMMPEAWCCPWPSRDGPEEYGGHHLGRNRESRAPRPSDRSLGQAEGLVHRARVTEVVGADEVLPRTVQSPRRLQLLRSDQAQTDAEVVPDRFWPPSPGKREIRRLAAHASRNERQKRGVFVVRVGRDDEEGALVRASAAGVERFDPSPPTRGKESCRAPRRREFARRGESPPRDRPPPAGLGISRPGSL